MSLRTSVTILVLLLGGIVTLPAAPNVFPVDELKPGMVGVGQTVFEGARIEEFKVHILGVMRNVIGPRRDLVLARLEGGPLAKTGVIAGMSGSPVYIDGRLLGAVSYSLGAFSKEPIAGITPISEMIEAAALDTPRPRASANAPIPTTDEERREGVKRAFAALRPFADRPADVRFVGAFDSSLTPSLATMLRPIALPMTMGGFQSGAIDSVEPAFRDAGLIRAPATTGQTATPASTARPLRPGDPVGVTLLSGDLEIGATGTVTHVEGDKVYAFGHPFYNLGSTQFPMTRAYVHAVLPSLDSSMKIASTGDVIGTVQQDRATTIAGTLGKGPSLIPITLSLTSDRGIKKTFRMSVVNDQLFTPLMTYLSIVETLGSYERQMGTATFTVKGNAALMDRGEVVFEDLFTGDQPSAGVGALIMTPINVLLRNTFEDVRIESVNLEIDATEQPMTGTLERAWVDAVEPKAGSTVPLKVLFRTYRGEEITQTLPIQIPANARGAVSVLVADGARLAQWESRELKPQPQQTRGLPQMIRVLNSARKNNRLYVRLISQDAGVVVKGESLSSLPASVLAVIEADRSSGNVGSIRSALLGEWELPTGHAVSGSRTLSLSID